jgi:superfamily II DNA/RNA helicase
LKELEEREGSVIIFVKTKHGADRLAEKLSRQNHHATAIHGDLKQRKRDEVIRNFRNLKNRIMVATDVAARGLDIPHIMHVINYDLPQCPEGYIHRIGRTGRAGMEGFALSLISPEEGHKWRRIHNLIHPGKSQEPPTRSPSQRRRKPRPFQNDMAPSKRSPFKRGAAPSEPPKGTDSNPASKRGRDFKKTNLKKADFKKPNFKRSAPKRSHEKSSSSHSSSQRRSWA